MINSRDLFVIDIVQSMIDSQIILAKLGLQLEYRSYFTTKRVFFLEFLEWPVFRVYSRYLWPMSHDWQAVANLWLRRRQVFRHSAAIQQTVSKPRAMVVTSYTYFSITAVAIYGHNALITINCESAHCQLEIWHRHSCEDRDRRGGGLCY